MAASWPSSQLAPPIPQAWVTEFCFIGSASSQLLQCDLACEDAGYYTRILHPLIDCLLLLVLVAVLLHSQIENFLRQTVECGEVLIGQSKTNVPIFRVRLRVVQKHIVVFDQPRLLLRIP